MYKMKRCINKFKNCFAILEYYKTIIPNKLFNKLNLNLQRIVNNFIDKTLYNRLYNNTNIYVNYN